MSKRKGEGIKLTKKGCREGLTQGLRFAILARDKFSCTYCGRKAPDVELQIDHIVPIAKGGKTVRTNLTTACKECNSGKRTRILLFDAPVIKEEINEIEYKKQKTTQLFDIFDESTKIIRVVRYEKTINILKNCIKEYGFNKTKKATKKATKQIEWKDFERKGKVEHRPDYVSIQKAFKSIPLLCQEG